MFQKCFPNLYLNVLVVSFIQALEIDPRSNMWIVLRAALMLFSGITFLVVLQAILLMESMVRRQGGGVTYNHGPSAPINITIIDVENEVWSNGSSWTEDYEESTDEETDDDYDDDDYYETETETETEDSTSELYDSEEEEVLYFHFEEDAELIEPRW